MGLIVNKEIYKEFEKQENELNSKFPYITQFPNYEIRQIKFENWQKEKKLLDMAIKNKLKEVYNIDDGIILFAEELVDSSDNGYSTKELEYYIVLILNFLENRKVK
ncbi:MAG: hypothetical protein WC438_06450 [Candidatus Pacearchaeota archaeon]